jgi:tetrahydromethanopterin S-methyltransferase subunit B
MGNIDEISHTIGRLESKVDQLITSHDTIAEKLERNSERLKEIEGYKNYFMGVVAVVSVIFTFIFDFVKHRIFGGA